MAARRQVCGWPRELWSSGSMPAPPITRVRNGPASVERKPSILAAIARPLRASWVPCIWSGPTSLRKVWKWILPRDGFLQMGKSSPTPGVLRMTASMAALVSFEESSSLLHELAGVEVTAKQAERAAEALGTESADYERTHRSRLLHVDCSEGQVLDRLSRYESRIQREYSRCLTNAASRAKNRNYPNEPKIQRNSRPPNTFRRFRCPGPARFRGPHTQIGRAHV